MLVAAAVGVTLAVLRELGGLVVAVLVLQAFSLEPLEPPILVVAVAVVVKMV
jgi:hypothetical protein